MLPLRILKESPMYEFLINEDKDRWKEEGRVQGQLEVTTNLLRQLIAKRFPGLKATRKIKRLHDVAALQQLCLEVGDLKDATALQERLDAAIKAQKR